MTAPSLPTPARVLLADDAPAIRRFVRIVLEESGLFEIVGEAGDGRAAVELAGRSHPDLAILDLSMPHMDGLETLPQLIEAAPDAKVVVFSGFEASRAARPALERGAAAYLEKGLPPAELVDRLVAVLGQPVAALPAAPARTPLSDREAEYRFLADHCTDMISRSTPDGIYLYASPACTRLLGYEPDELAGSSAYEYVHPADRFLLESALGRALGSTDVAAATYRVRHRDGRYRWMETTSQRVQDECTDEVVEIIAASRDVTARRRAEQELRDAEERFRLAFEDAAIGMAVVALDGHWLKVNASLCEMLGRLPEDLLSTDFQSVTHPDDLDASLELQQRMLDGEIGAHSFEKRYLHATGYVIWAQVSISLARDDEGRPLYFISQAEDITARKWAGSALMASEQRFRTIFESAGVGMALADLDGRCIEANTALDDMLGFEPGEFRGLSFAAVSHPEDLERGRTALDRLTSGRIDADQVESRFRRKDGGTVWVRVNTSLVRDPAGEPQHIIAVIENVTERKHAELALARAVAEVERRAAELEQSNADLTQFAYVASHDLTEPLRMVSSYLQLLSSRYRGRLDGDADEFIGYAVDGAARMQQLIDDLLDYARLGTSSRVPARVDCNVLLDDVQQVLAPAVESSGATVIVEALPSVVGDEVQLRQLFQNLVSNALKFRSERAPVVRVDGRAGPDGMRFSVTDNGIGIEPDQAERIFMMFQRLHGREEYEGTGIGLAICRRIVERHGGRIWVERVAEGGTRFCFTIAAPFGTVTP